MKQIFTTLFALLFLFLLGLQGVQAQETNMPTAGTETITECDGTIYDSGGPDGPYSENETGILVIDPDGDDYVQLTFDFFDVENSGAGCWDRVLIYDGADTNAVLIAPGEDESGWCWGAASENGSGNLVGMPILSSGSALTIAFTSDDIVQNDGFVATYTCIDAESPPVAGFSVSETQTCTGIITFTDESILNPNSWTWDFGDGEMSTEQSPTYTYTTEGSYTVSLEVCNDFGCETLVLEEQIVFDSQDQSCFETFMPTSGTTTINTCIGTIYDSGGPDGNYQSNENGILIIEPTGADLVALTFSVFQVESGFENLFIYNGAGIDGTVLYQSTGTDIPNSGETIISEGTNALTLQFTSDGSVEDIGFEALYECINVDEAPEANFAFTPPFSCDGLVQFIDKTLFPPSSWEWNFGDGETSTEQNPLHFYMAEGIYDVSLTVCNDFGCTSQTQTVTIFNGSNPACTGVNLPTAGNEQIDQCFGILYDSGGSGGVFGDQDNGSVTIGVPNADGVSLAFTDFNLGFGQVNVYDGEDNNSPLIGSFNGDGLPFGGNTIESSGAFLTIELIGGFSSNSGFQAYWAVEGSANPPISNFEVDGGNNVPNNQPIQFIDLSENSPTAWVWDFGDGNTSFDQNPVHTYTISDQTVTVSLIASNCSGESEVFTQELNIQGGSVIIVNPSSFTIELESGEMLDTALTISNFGVGDLIFDIEGLENTYSGIIQVLLYNYDSDASDDNQTRDNIVNILQENVFGLNIFETNTTDPEALALELENIDVFMILGKKGSIDTDVMTDLSPVIQDFMNEGGGVVFTPSQFNSEAIFNTGVFEGSYGGGLYNPLLEFTDAEHPVTIGVDQPFEGKQGCFGYNITNEDKNTIITEDGFDVLTVRENDNEGRAVFLGFNYLYSNDNMDELLINSVLYAANVDENQWLFVNPISGNITAAGNQIVDLFIDATNTPAGTYTVILEIYSNAQQGVIEVPVTVIVTGAPQINVSTTEVDFGNVVQFTEESVEVTIVNTGSDTLFIYDVIPGLDEFSVDITEFFIYPGLSETITITFSPQDIETLTDIPLTIISNDGEIIIDMNANATGAPVSTANPIPIEVTVDVGGTTSTELTISNPGAGFLEYELVNPLSSIGELQLDFLTDNFGTEFFWQVVDSEGNIIQENGPNFYESNTVYSETITGLEPCESYKLLLQDTFGDGALEQYTVTDTGTGNIIAEGEFIGGDLVEVDLGDNSTLWVSYDNVTGELPFPTGEETITLDFDPGCLLGGTYTVILVLNTNDPLNPVIEIPVIMNVVGIPVIEVDNYSTGQSDLDFGSIIIGLDNEITFDITNTGTDSLHIEEFLFENGQFSSDYADVTLEPGETITVTIIFTPDTIGDASSTLTIVNNDEDFVIDLIAFGQGAPSITTNPSSIEVEMQAGETEEVDIVIANPGDGPLEYEITIGGEGVGFIFDFTLDNFGNEFFWSIVDSQGNVVASGGPGEYESNTDYSVEVTGLNPNETYTLILEDTFGDGGLDAYTITDLISGDVIVTGTFPDGNYMEESLGSPTAYDIISITPNDEGIIDIDSEEGLTLIIDTEGLEAGVYIIDVIITTNDPQNPTIIIPVTINVSAFPQAVFSANNEAVVCGDESIQFTDLSVNVPTNWEWDFGDGGSSDEQNPVYSYSQTGVYSVTLIASNEVGSDTTVLENLINVDMNCAVVIVPPTPSPPTIATNCNGKVYDSGGDVDDVSGNYFDNSQGIVTIAPTGSVSVTLTFESFVFNELDTLKIYDGPDIDSDLIGAYTGTALPNGGTITSSAGAITIQEVANGFLNDAGFVAFFSCEAPEGPPIPEFSFEASGVECLGAIQFTNESIFATGFEWDFGDGNSSEQQNPIHQYTETGNYSVILTASNDFGDESIVQEIEVAVFNPTVTMPDTVYLDIPANFEAETVAGAQYSWEFGDGATNNLPLAEHTYNYPNDTMIIATVTINNFPLGQNCEIVVMQDIVFLLEMDTMMIDTTDTSGVGLEILDYAKLEMYPNPTDGQFMVNLELDEIDDIKMIVSSSTGQILFTREWQNTQKISEEINLKGMTNGVYFLRFISNDRQAVRRIILNR